MLSLLLHCSAIGDLYNFHLDPSLTLGCGSWGSTSVSANVGPQHLINIKTGAGLLRTARPLPCFKWQLGQTC